MTETLPPPTPAGPPPRRRKAPMELLWFALAIVAWFSLQRWVLPALGVPT